MGIDSTNLFYNQIWFKHAHLSGPDGAFALDPDEQKRPFLFDAKAMEEPLNVVSAHRIAR